ncbi:hypothetical protein [Helicobacter acinonychis]|uniref:Outer membrane protein n=1 Tax=Helicobacter acinonychis (strain Sheeba) TaxID=382638 RepID=Q17WP9_HELAH|nr:hypothetical protein [Helicobacter acinonychis]CAJ99927.1 conserved hypothetical protein [Helicobacter acinonychis str. Sheeba]STP04476.1 membrane protein [Helicobacter acinonychis]
MGFNKQAVLLSLMGFYTGLNALDYDTLDPKYYKYIKYYKAYEDKEVEELIKNLKRANAKSGLILGINTGFFYNHEIMVKTNSSSITGNILNYLFAYGLRFGYQTFRPSFFARLVRPNIIGRRIYIQYYGGVPKKADFGSVGFQSVMLNGDFLLDFPLPFVGKYLYMGGYMGLGLGVVSHGINYTAEWGMSFNAGLALTILEKNRIEFGLKILNNFPFLQSSSSKETWWGAIANIGYQYVF